MSANDYGKHAHASGRHDVGWLLDDAGIRLVESNGRHRDDDRPLFRIFDDSSGRHSLPRDVLHPHNDVWRYVGPRIGLHPTRFDPGYVGRRRLNDERTDWTVAALVSAMAMPGLAR